MESDLTNSGVILMHGPPFVGKNKFYQDALAASHSCISPTVLFRNDPSIGLRDVTLEALRVLKQGHKVVVLDPNGKKKVRKSYIQLLKKKCDHVLISLISIIPQYGCQQLLWSREIHLAEESLLPESKRRPLAGEEHVLKWFEKESDEDITYKHGTVDAVSEDEGLNVVRKRAGLCVVTPYKFEVPGLFIQWEVLCSITRDGRLTTSRLTKVLQHWCSQNPCGRVLVVCDGIQIRTGEKSKSQQRSNIRNIVTQMISNWKDCPVYVLLVEDPQSNGGYAVPPKPGLLAFIQRRHNLDLHSRTSLYLYETSSHMKMADDAGVRHIKASRVLDHPSLVISSHAAVTPTIRPMLRDIKFVLEKEAGTAQNAAIPLADQGSMFTESNVHTNLGGGRSEFMFAENWDIIQRYQDLYNSMATLTGVSGSKITPKMENQSHTDTDDHETSHVGTSVMDQSKQEYLSRDLPKWMLPKDSSRSSKSSFSSNRSDSTSSTETRIRKMMYVMTEKEMVEAALDILKQAGKTEVIARYEKGRQKNTEDKNITDTKLIRHTKDSKTTPKDTSNDSRTYPKMEPFDEETVSSDGRNVCVRVEGVVQSKPGNNNEMEIKNKDDNLGKEVQRLEKIVRREEAANDVLDDFLSVTTTRRSSPRKRIRNLPEPEDTWMSDSKQSCVSGVLDDLFDTTKPSRNRAVTMGRKLAEHGGKQGVPCQNQRDRGRNKDRVDDSHDGNIDTHTNNVEIVTACREGMDDYVEDVTKCRTNTRKVPTMKKKQKLDLSILDGIL